MNFKSCFYLLSLEGNLQSILSGGAYRFGSKPQFLNAEGGPISAGQIDATVVEDQGTHGFVYGLGPTMLALNAAAAEISRTDIPVLILGESGTGKDAYARLIHSLSQRADRNLWKINCSMVEPGILLAQVQKATDGPLTQASPGSIYLDNIQELDLACQRVLPSQLPDGEGAGVGLAGARFISSTTKRLESEVEAGRFRRELYFRLNGACLRLPALRERREDIPVLLEYFLSKQSSASKKKVAPLSKKALQTLVEYHWPGNIRELENVARKIVIFGDVQMVLNDLQTARIINQSPAYTGRGASLKVAARAASKETERELIVQALERTHWNRKRAAQELQISYKSLLYKIKQIGTLNQDK
jgi:two-component system, NtrC family, response regulator AtoC